MVWINNITDLEYYNASNDLPCYGDVLFRPSDLILQGQVPKVPSNIYSLTVRILSVDGLTDYGSFVSYFDWYIGLNTDGINYFNLRLREWPPIVCQQGCFILEVIVENRDSEIVFRKYTQKYIVGDCSITASDVTITLDSVDIATNCAATAPLFDTCGNKFKQLYTTFNCIDQFTGDYYGLPVTTYVTSGVSPFAFYKSSWIQAEAFYDPLDTKRTISLNCRVQKTERTRHWTLLGTGNGAFSIWKAVEIEDQFSAENIFFNGVSYSFEGGAIFQRILREECRMPTHFRLRTTLSSCYEFQIEGCTNDCG